MAHSTKEASRGTPAGNRQQAGAGGAAQQTAAGVSPEPAIQTRLSENVRRLRFMQMSKGGKQHQQQPQHTGERAFQQQQLLMLQQEQQRLQALKQEQEIVKRAQQASSACHKQQGHTASTQAHGEGPQQNATAAAAARAQTGHPPGTLNKHNSGVQPRLHHDRQQQEYLRQRQLEERLSGWCAPGWEIAESLYELQQQREEQILSNACAQYPAFGREACGKYVLYRRSYGGFNSAVEAQMRRVEKKVHAVERRREEEKEAVRWQQARAGRHHIFFT